VKYNGELSIDPKALYGAQHFVVMVPKSMLFTPAAGVAFQSMEDPRQSDALVRVVSDTGAGQPLNFRISGTGTLNEPGDDSQGAPHPVEHQTADPSTRDSHPGGGLAPLGAPDPPRDIAGSSWVPLACCWAREPSTLQGAPWPSRLSAVGPLTGENLTAHPTLLQPRAVPIFSLKNVRGRCFSSK
jgi:hypothetical protein